MTHPSRSFRDVLLIAALVLLERAVIFVLFDISPRPELLVVHWQHLSLERLRDDLWQSILTLHSQGPVWNMILGGLSIACDAAAACVNRSLHALHVAFTIVIAWLLFEMLKACGVARGRAFVLVALYAALPSTIFYEAYSFYPHLTLFLVTVALFFSLRLGTRSSAWALLATLLPLVLLSWTWGIFHPLIMIAAAVTLVAVNRLCTAAHLCVLAAACLLLLAPSAKNATLFGFWGGSSWLGLNIAQVAPHTPDGCSFQQFRATLPEISHDGTAMNHPTIIPYAARCQDAAIGAILDAPARYARMTLDSALRSTQKTPTDYFFAPKGFDAYPRWDNPTRFRTADGQITLPSALAGLVTPLYNIFVFAVILAAPCVLRAPFTSPAILAFYCFFCLVVVGHLANAIEQERFRYSLNAVSFLILSLAALRVEAWLRTQIRTPRRAGAP